MTWPWVLLGWVGFVPWLAALDRAASLRGVLVRAWLFSVVYVLAIFPWFASGIAAYTGTAPALAFLLLALGAPLVQPQLLVYAVVRRLARAPAGVIGVRAALAGAALYVGAEWGFGKLLGDTIGHGLFASPRIRQAADLAGAHGLTFALLLVNECALATAKALAAPGLLSRARWRLACTPAAAAAGLVLALTGYGAWRLARLELETAAAPLVTAGLVQADISRYGELAREHGTYDAVRGHPRRAVRALARGARARAARSARLAGDGLPDDVRHAQERRRAPPSTARSRASSRAQACRSSSAPMTPRPASNSTPQSSSSRRATDGSSSRRIARRGCFR